MNLIETDNISIYGILEDDKLISVYIFRQAAMVYDGGEVVEVISALSGGGGESKNVFYTGFTIALHKCCKEWTAKNVVIKGLGDSDIITDYLKMRDLKPYTESSASASAFYIYNYVSYTIPSNKCFILN